MLLSYIKVVTLHDTMSTFHSAESVEILTADCTVNRQIVRGHSITTWTRRGSLGRGSVESPWGFTWQGWIVRKMSTFAPSRVGGVQNCVKLVHVVVEWPLASGSQHKLTILQAVKQEGPIMNQQFTFISPHYSPGIRKHTRWWPYWWYILPYTEPAEASGLCISGAYLGF